MEPRPTWAASWLARFRRASPSSPRAAFADGVDRVLSQGAAVTLVYLNVTRFRAVVRHCGAEGADGILRALGQRLRASAGALDVLRLPGDEFVLAFSHLADDAAVDALLRSVARIVAEPMPCGGGTVALAATLGAASSWRDGGAFQDLFDRAEAAMLAARGAGGIAGPAREVPDRDEADALRIALMRGEFVLHYQPQVELRSGNVIGAEALIRWQHPERGLLAPGHFIEAAERTGMIVPIGRWVLREACRQAAQWRAGGWAEPQVAVNLSARQFESGMLVQSVQEALDAAGLPPSCLELELTETILIHDTENVLKQIRQLKSMGLALSLDDFGTGYSSLSYLKKFAVDKIKIDRSFVSGVRDDPNDAAIVRAIIQIARSLGLSTIAEGVEDARTLDCLHLLGCDEVQGYHFAPPLSPSAFATLLDVLERDNRSRANGY